MTDQTLTDEIAAVHGVSRSVAQRVAETFGSRRAVAEASEDELTEVKGVGSVTAERILDALADLEPSAAETDVRALHRRDAAERARGQIERAAADAGEAAGRAAETTQEVADDALGRLVSACEAAGAGVTAAAGTVSEQWPEVRSAFAEAFAETRELGRTVVQSVRTVVREPQRRAR